jgi:hypothetical protein
LVLTNLESVPKISVSERKTNLHRVGVGCPYFGEQREKFFPGRVQDGINPGKCRAVSTGDMLTTRRRAFGYLQLQVCDRGSEFSARRFFPAAPLRPSRVPPRDGTRS